MRFEDRRIERTSVVAGHRMPERSEGRAEPKIAIIVSYLDLNGGSFLRLLLLLLCARKRDELTTPCLAMVQWLQTLWKSEKEVSQAGKMAVRRRERYCD